MAGDDSAVLGPPRAASALFHAVPGAVVIGLAFITRQFELIFDQMELRELPLATEAFPFLSGFVRSPAGLTTASVLDLGLVAMALRGSLVRFLKRLLWAHVIDKTLILPAWFLGVYLPILKIRQALGK
jgi:hypothetical protein